MAPIETIKKRADFLAVRGGSRWACIAFVIEACARPASDKAGAGPRFGFTVTKKLGNAVTRNRIRRRLKAAVAVAAPEKTKPGFDYVIIARGAAETRLFADLTTDITRGLEAVHHQRHVPHHAKPRQPKGAATPTASKKGLL